jgi:hypothetical protein
MISAKGFALPMIRIFTGLSILKSIAPLVLWILFLNACTTTSTKTTDQGAGATAAPLPTNTGTVSIDLDGLQRSLGLDAPESGFFEKSFDTCQVGYGYSSSHDCHTAYFVVVNFQLQCRDSDGTVSDVDYTVTPVVSDKIKWNLGKQEGFIATDVEGHGRVRAITRSKNHTQKLRLTVDGDFLILNAGDVKRIVAPKSWCEHH